MEDARIHPAFENPKQAEEQARLDSLRSFSILDTLPGQEYDDITELASFICGTPISLVSLLDAERQWFKSAHGLALREMPRSQGFCAHTLSSARTLIVSDTAKDSRFRDNPLVLDGPRIRFYAGAPILDGAGRVLGTVCVLDIEPRLLAPRQVAALEALARQVNGMIEQRRAAVSAAEAAEEQRALSFRMTLAAEAAELGIFSWEAENGWVTWENDRMYAIFRRTREQGTLNALQFAAECVVPAYAPSFLAALDRSVTTAGRLFWQGMFRRGDGTEGWLEMTGQAACGPDNFARSLFGTAADITARMETESALRSAAERDRLAHEAAQIASWEWVPGTGSLVWNGDTTPIYGRAPHELTTLDQWLGCVHPEDRDAVLAAIAPARDGKGGFHTDFRVCWPDGSTHSIVTHGAVVRSAALPSYTGALPATPRARFALQSSGPLPDTAAPEPEISHPAPHRVVGVNINATERRLAEAALRQAEKLAAVGRLASAIAHEMNNPLESVTNLLYLARHADGLPSLVEDYLDTAERELRRVNAIMQQTLRFHRQSTSPRLTSPAELFESVLSLYQGRLVNARIEVRREERPIPPILCYEGEIRQVLSSLVGNAVDAMHPSAGRLHLRSHEGTDWRMGRPGVLLTIADSGLGMTPEVKRQLFKAFFTTKGIGGTGLGLWVAREIAERHAGRLRFRSSAAPGPRRGTTFTLFLPLHPPTR